MDIKKLIRVGKKIADSSQTLWNNGGKSIYSQLKDKLQVSDISINDILVMGQEAISAIDSIHSNESISNNSLSSDIDALDHDAELEPNMPSDSVIEISECMTEEEENAYLKNLTTSLSAPADIKMSLVKLCDKTLDTIKFCEAQETKRTEIVENANVQIEQIRAQKEFLMNYLEKTFDERRSIFSKEFEVLDKALETGNTAIMAQCLNSITALAQSSPFKALTDADFSSLQSGEMILDI